MSKFILVIIYLLTIGILFGCIFYLVENRNRKTETYLYVMALVCVELWCGSQILIFISDSQKELLLAYLIGNFGICFIGSSWLVFSVIFGGRFKKNKALAIPFLYSLVMYAMICTNPLHNLYYTEFHNGNIEYGVMFYINILYDYICVILGVLILLTNLPKQKKYRWVKAALACSVTIPLILNVIYQCRYDNLHYDLTPLGFSVGCLLVLLITFKWNAFDVKLNVYDETIKSMRDGMFIFDSENKLIFYNKSAESIVFDITEKHMDENSYEIFMEILTEQQKKELENHSETLFLLDEMGKYHIQKHSYFDKTEKRVAVAYIFRDITKYYELEQKSKELLNYRQKLEIEQEHNRIVQIIHDSIGHNLTIIRSLIFVSRSKIEETGNSESRDISDIIENLNQAAGLAGESLKKLRETINNLNNEKKYCLVTQKISELIEQVKGIEIEVIVQGRDDEKYMYLSDVLYENLREAVTNTLKYGNATKMDVILRFGKKDIEMFIFDNGKGCSSICHGNGLNGMMKRTKDVGGSIQFASEADEGFRIIIKLLL